MRKRLMRTSILTSILVGLLMVAAGEAFSQIDTAPLYHITAKHSGRCLDVERAGVANGVQVIQFDCGEGDNQKWQFVSVSPGYYKILAKHSAKALDVFGGIVSQGNGAIVEQWDYNGGTNQMWALTPLGDDYYTIRPRHSQGCLDIDGGPGATANGRKAQQWQCTGADNQKFRLTALARPTCAADQIGSSLVGTAELTANRVSGRPFPASLNLGIDVTQCRGNIRIVQFPPITTEEYTTMVGQNRTTLTLGSGGSGTISTGRSISVPVMLHLEHTLASNPATAAQGAPSDLTLTLEGSVTPDGQVTLAGSGRFVGGYLNGSTGVVRVTGRLSPSP